MAPNVEIDRNSDICRARVSSNVSDRRRRPACFGLVTEDDHRPAEEDGRVKRWRTDFGGRVTGESASPQPEFDFSSSVANSAALSRSRKSEVELSTTGRRVSSLSSALSVNPQPHHCLLVFCSLLVALLCLASSESGAGRFCGLGCRSTG